MKSTIPQPANEAAIWSRIVHPEDGGLSPEVAHALLELDFTAADVERMEELAEKANRCTLTTQERHDAESYNRVAHLLALLQSKARQSLRGKKRT